MCFVLLIFLWLQAVAAHERGMREQAKKMNVASLRSSEAANTSAECKLAKVQNFLDLKFNLLLIFKVT